MFLVSLLGVVLLSVILNIPILLIVMNINKAQLGVVLLNVILPNVMTQLFSRVFELSFPICMGLLDANLTIAILLNVVEPFRRMVIRLCLVLFC